MAGKNERDVTGAMFFWNEEPHVTGYLVIGDEHFEIAGVRRSKIRTDFVALKRGQEVQTDMFDDPSGSGR